MYALYLSVSRSLGYKFLDAHIKCWPMNLLYHCHQSVCPTICPINFVFVTSPKPKGKFNEKCYQEISQCVQGDQCSLQFFFLRTDDKNKKINAWIDIYFLTYFHSKLYK
jgi:hypothetical protein